MPGKKARSLEKNLLEAVEILKKGGIVAAATETFFGLMADIEGPRSIQKIRKIKGLDSVAPLLIIVPSLAAARRLCETLGPRAEKLAKRYWPGPLTMILRARMTVPPYLVGPYNTIALRIPGESDARELLRLYDKPLTATSCNLHGEPPATTGRQVREVFKGKIDFIMPGTSPGGLPSTIVDTTTPAPIIRRRGIVNVEGKFVR